MMVFVSSRGYEIIIPHVIQFIIALSSIFVSNRVFTYLLCTTSKLVRKCKYQLDVDQIIIITMDTK